MSDDDTVYIPPGSQVWVGPVGSEFPTIVNGEPHTLDEDGVTKWDKLGVPRGDA